MLLSLIIPCKSNRIRIFSKECCLQPVYINIMRDPVDHLISNYYYKRTVILQHRYSTVACTSNRQTPSPPPKCLSPSVSKSRNRERGRAFLFLGLHTSDLAVSYFFLREPDALKNSDGVSELTLESPCRCLIMFFVRNNAVLS
jgi:hypothetical protein